MKGFTPLVVGLLATLAFSWLGLAYIPDLQIGHLEPQSDEEGTDIYPMPRSGMAERGRRVYVANGCFYCHSQQVRADYAAADVDLQRWAAPSPRPRWGDRRSAPRDYIFDRPALIGKTRLGPDLANIGKAAPAEEEAAPAQPAPAGSPGGSPAPANASPAPGNASAPANAPAQPGAKPPGNRRLRRPHRRHNLQLVLVEVLRRRMPRQPQAMLRRRQQMLRRNRAQSRRHNRRLRRLRRRRNLLLVLHLRPHLPNRPRPTLPPGITSISILRAA